MLWSFDEEMVRLNQPGDRGARCVKMSFFLKIAKICFVYHGIPHELTDSATAHVPIVTPNLFTTISSHIVL